MSEPSWDLWQKIIGQVLKTVFQGSRGTIWWKVFRVLKKSLSQEYFPTLNEIVFVLSWTLLGFQIFFPRVNAHQLRTCKQWVERLFLYIECFPYHNMKRAHFNKTFHLLEQTLNNTTNFTSVSFCMRWSVSNSPTSKNSCKRRFNEKNWLPVQKNIHH